jgi:hypothetical protein
MNKKQADRRPDERPPEQSAGRYDPSKPQPGRLPEDPQEDREFRKPAGRPVDNTAAARSLLRLAQITGSSAD